MNATPNLSMCNHDCIATLRMVQEVTRIAQNSGYRGDPLADPVPQPRTVGDLYAAGDLFLGLPPDLRNSNRDLAKRFCEAAVFGSCRQTICSPLPLSIKCDSTALKSVGERSHDRKTKPASISPIDRANRHALAHRAKQRRRASA